MEDVLAVYTRPHDPNRPLVCPDETSKKLVAETRAPMPVAPGLPARYDYEYKRNGTANLFEQQVTSWLHRRNKISCESRLALHNPRCAHQAEKPIPRTFR